MNRKYFVTGLVFLVTAAGFAQGVQMTYEHERLNETDYRNGIRNRSFDSRLVL